MKVRGKVIVVTGGGSGIGRELVLGLLARGARVAVVDIREPALRETAAQAGAPLDRLSLHVLDITDREAVRRLPEQVIAHHGTVDGLINNAGIIQPFVRVQDLDEEAIERVMRVNFYGTLYMVRAFLPYLLKRPEAHIVNISSMGGFLPVPGQTIYGASKAAVKLLTEGLYTELLGTPVLVTVVFPGAVATDIAAHSGVEIHSPVSTPRSIRALPPREAARIILDGMERDRYRILVGSDAVWMDLLYRISPKRAAHLIFNRMQSLLEAGSGQ
jgi:NAD(P)-dependent dehydrogenase (short-subunit alcohol dehydrogenase family)